MKIGRFYIIRNTAPTGLTYHKADYRAGMKKARRVATAGPISLTVIAIPGCTVRRTYHDPASRQRTISLFKYPAESARDAKSLAWRTAPSRQRFQSRVTNS
jgi:hypothetical protein